MRKPSEVSRTHRGESHRVVRRLVCFAVAASLALVAVAGVSTAVLGSDASSSDLRTNIVAINEARFELDQAEQEVESALDQAQEALRGAANSASILPLVLIWGLCLAGIAATCLTCIYLYFSIVRPFIRLEAFADDVAQGKLDTPLAYERSNPFGRFTWAFDNMRKEIRRARAAEALAVEQNKTTAAALSHDVKTPIASIRAYSEALELGVARTDEERSAYARTIMRKCDEVAQLTDDLFLHALADLDHITVVCEPAPIHQVLRQAVGDFDATGAVHLVRADAVVVSIDRKRFAQVVENLLANAHKYAPRAAVQVEGKCTTHAYSVSVRDFGPGMSPEDIPFAFDRFYRGANAKEAPGAGLGLFIVRYLVEQMGGVVRAENATPGLLVTIEFPLDC